MKQVKTGGVVLSAEKPAYNETGSALEGAVDYALLFERHQSELIRYLYGMVGEVETARDLTQETFARGYKVWLERPERREDGRGWRALLYKIATNCALDLLRRRRKIRFSVWDETSQAEPDLIEAATTGPDFSGQLELRLSVLTALSGLDPEAATCLLLHYDQGFSCAEIATITGQSLPATWQRLSRARRLFSNLYQKEQANDA